MRKSVIVGCCLLAASCFLSAQQKKYLDHLSDYIENTSVFGWNQEEGRAYHIPEKHISLNGDWKFFFSDTPEGIPSDFYKENFNDKAWSLIPVPSNWEMQGYGDKLFRNVHAPFKANPPWGLSEDFYASGIVGKRSSISSFGKGGVRFVCLGERTGNRL